MNRRHRAAGCFRRGLQLRGNVPSLACRDNRVHSVGVERHPSGREPGVASNFASLCKDMEYALGREAPEKWPIRARSLAVDDRSERPGNRL